MARVLVVDDDVFTQQLVGDILCLEGFDVSLADTLEAASAILHAAPCDLVVADLLKPAGATHLEAIQRLHTGLVGTPTLLLTAYAEAKEWPPHELGMAAVMTKPFVVDELLQTVREVLKTRRSKHGATA